MTSIGSGVRDIRIQESWSGSSHLCRRTRRSGLGAPRISEEDSADAAARCWISSAALSLAAERQDIRMKMQKFEDVPDALCDGDRATQMKRRAQPQAAKLPGVRQPRINDLLRGRLHRFSVYAPASVLCGRACIGSLWTRQTNASHDQRLTVGPPSPSGCPIPSSRSSPPGAR